MTSYLSRLSPIPGFPEYTGPHKVGTIDVELPVSELEAPSPPPDSSISTIQYRIFYPCESDSKSKSISWIPRPQREYVSAYTRFLGAGSTLAELISYFPRLLHYITIPVLKNAPLLQPSTKNKKWPVMVFSHGLGGSRNAYSHLVGSIASHGVIVIAPEHRDGSTPISFIRDVPTANTNTEKSSSQTAKRTADYLRLSHTPGPEVEAGRNAQLKIRLWEMGLVHDSLLKLDQGFKLTNLNTSSTPLQPFAGQMDVHSPGKITFAGHSFGAATVAQLVKSTYYASQTSSAPASYEPLFMPSSRSSISSQITPHTPVILLDIWCLPLRAASTRWLWNQPFPCYKQSQSNSSPGGSSLLAIESDAFFKWRVHLEATKQFLSPDPSSSKSFDYSKNGVQPPNFFYVETAAHLSQSDFGLLFPWVAKRFLKVEEPERIMRLNVRAITQSLRCAGIEVEETSRVDMELDGYEDESIKDDPTILQRDGTIRGWKSISTSLEGVSDSVEAEEARGESENGKASDAAPVVGDEIVKTKSRSSGRL